MLKTEIKLISNLKKDKKIKIEKATPKDVMEIVDSSIIGKKFAFNQTFTKNKIEFFLIRLSHWNFYYLSSKKSINFRYRIKGNITDIMNAFIENGLRMKNE